MFHFIFPYFGANFSLAVNPKPAITIYIKLLNRFISTLYPNHVLPINAAAHSRNVKNVITRLLLIISVLSLNICLTQIIIIPYSSGCGKSGTMALPLAVTAGAVGAPNPVLLPKLVVVADVLPNPLPPKPLVVGAEEPNPPDAAPNPAEDELGVVNPLDDKLNPPLDDPPGGVGVGGLSHPLFAASNACFCASGLLPASIMPDNVPVRNVAIGIISSKNF